MAGTNPINNIPEVHTIPEVTPNRSTQAVELFDELSTEIYYGFNMKMVLANTLADSDLIVIRKFVELCKNGRSNISKVEEVTNA